jgi:2-(3-amino-3-carboxypropyl)histidine synthase
MMETRNIQGLKTIFIPAEVEGINIRKSLKKINIKEKKIGLISAIQFAKYLGDVKLHLEKEGKKVFIAGQMVGCNAGKAIQLKEKVDAYLFVGSGEFHPLELIDSTKIKKLYFLNPVTEKFSKFGSEELTRLEKKRRAKISKYLMEDKIGILVSTKPGQEHLKAALKFKETCGKEAYVFLADEIDINRLEDFNDIKLWVNTCCPRLEGKNIVSFRDIQKL